VLSVPTSAERQGIDTTSFPGDTLIVPVNPAVKPILDGYPLPNAPTGPFGARTYETSSKVSTNYDQFSSSRPDPVSRSPLFARFSYNHHRSSYQSIKPPSTSFGIQFFDHQRSTALSYARD
jgi:hypothetical protein